MYGAILIQVVPEVCFAPTSADDVFDAACVTHHLDLVSSLFNIVPATCLCAYARQCCYTRPQQAWVVVVSREAL